MAATDHVLVLPIQKSFEIPLMNDFDLDGMDGFEFLQVVASYIIKGITDHSVLCEFSF